MRQQEEDMCGANRALTRHLEDTQVSLSDFYSGQCKNKKEVSEQNIITQIQLPYLSLRIIDMSVIHMAVILFFCIYTVITGDNHIRSDIYSGRKTQVGYCVCTVELFPSTVEFSYLIAQINFFYNSSSDHVGCSKSHMFLFFCKNSFTHTCIWNPM